MSKVSPLQRNLRNLWPIHPAFPSDGEGEATDFTDFTAEGRRFMSKVSRLQWNLRNLWRILPTCPGNGSVGAAGLQVLEGVEVGSSAGLEAAVGFAGVDSGGDEFLPKSL